MFERIDAAPPDPILGLTEQFHADPRAEKLDLAAGVYRDEHGHTPVFRCVKEAELRHLQAETTKTYLPIAGPALFAEQVGRLVFGDAASDRLEITQTPGGTGALAAAAHMLSATVGSRTVWVSDPTWPNHEPVFSRAGHQVATYGYYLPADRQLDFESMISDLRRAEPGDAVVLHGGCHNPTGRDLDLDQWHEVARVCAERDLTAIVDLAYLGLARGIDDDASVLRPLLESRADLLVCVSFSKNMGLYRERVGALAVVGRDGACAQAVQSNVKRVVRTLWSNPPSFGGSVAATVLADPGLRGQWEEELAQLRDRLNGIRSLLAKAVADAGLHTLEGIDSEHGMFMLTGLSLAQVEWLRAEHGIYLVGAGGRANVAGLTSASIPRFVEALGQALLVRES